MGEIIPDDVIEDLLREKKYLPRDYRKRLKLKSKSMKKHEEKELKTYGENDSEFYVVLRKNRIDPTDFSIILRYRNENGKLFNMVRYNGKHKHYNKLEGSFFRNYHIHKATQRYQENGFRIETYAEPTNLYGSFEEALKKFFEDLNFIVDAPSNTSDILSYGGD